MTGKYWDKNSQQWVSRPPAGNAAPPPPPLPPQPPSYPAFPPPPPAEPPLITTPRAPRPERTPRPPITGKRRILVVALAGALLGVLAGGGGYLLTRHDDGAEPTGAATLPGTPTGTAPGSASGTPSATAPGSASGTPSATASAPPTATESPSPTAPTPTPTPTGPHLKRVQDLNGFTLLVPDGWQRDEENGSVFYRTPDKLSLIQVYAMDTDPPYRLAERTDADLAKNKASAGYRRLRLEQTAGGTAELEYSYDYAPGVVRRAVDHILVGPNGTGYSVIVAGPEGDWPTLLQDLREAELTGFCFTAQCPAGTG